MSASRRHTHTIIQKGIRMVQSGPGAHGSRTSPKRLTCQHLDCARAASPRSDDMQRPWCEKETRSGKTAKKKKKTQLDLTRDNTPIHHRSRGDSTSLHSDSSQRRTHTRTHSGVTKSTSAKHTTTHVSTSSNQLQRLFLCVCVCVSLH